MSLLSPKLDHLLTAAAVQATDEWLSEHYPDEYGRLSEFGQKAYRDEAFEHFFAWFTAEYLLAEDTATREFMGPDDWAEAGDRQARAEALMER